MPHENNQAQQPNMTPDEAAASLSFATMLSEQMMPKSPQTPETAPGSEKAPETDIEPEKEEDTATGDLEAKLDEFKEEVKTLIKEGFEGLKTDEKDDDKADEKE